MNQSSGFTLVEISIVMIIIGLLIGGTFGGMQLVENARVNKTVQDLKSAKSSALTFKDTYGRLPGDLVNPSARLPNCTVAPCATGGDGNRIVGIYGMYGQTITAASENFTFWHHLQAADLISIGIKNTTDMNYGEGQPESPVGGGYLFLNWGNISLGPGACPTRFSAHGFIVSSANDGNYTTGSPTDSVQCTTIRSIDSKMDDGMPLTGYLMGTYPCHPAVATCNDSYIATGVGKIYTKGF